MTEITKEATAEVSKGQRFNLTKASGGQQAFYVGLGWDAPEQASGQKFDLDVSVFGLDENGKLVDDKYFVYFGNLRAPNDSVVHSGDNLTGEGDGDDEQIRVYLDKVDPRVEQLSIIVCVYDARNRGQNFGQVNRASVQVATMDATGNPPTKTDSRGRTVVDSLVRYTLSDDYSSHTAVQVGSIYRREDGDWAFNPTGVGFENTEIGDIVRQYTA